MYDLVKSGKSGVVLTSMTAGGESRDSSIEERALLLSERRRTERAIKRLMAAYLYDESGMPEKDFILERKKLTDTLAGMDARIAELDRNVANSFDLSDEDFMAKASFFIISQQLAERRFINYAAYIKASDPKSVRDFVTSVIQNFCIMDGKIRSITFKNGIEHRFIYETDRSVKKPELPDFKGFRARHFLLCHPLSNKHRVAAGKTVFLKLMYQHRNKADRIEAQKH